MTKNHARSIFSQLTTAAVTAAALATATSAQVYVDADAPGLVQDGTSWNTAYLDLGTALNNQSVNAPVEVWVAEGTYLPNNVLEQSFVLHPGWELYGGFIGFDPTGQGLGQETSTAARQGRATRCVLSGDLTGSNAAAPGNSEHVVRIASNIFSTVPTAATVLDRFRIQYGYADTPSIAPWSQQGGGIVLGNNVDLVSARLSNLQVRDNYAAFAGGGIASLATANLELRRSTIRDNAVDTPAGGVGAGLYLNRLGQGFGGPSSGAAIYNCQFHGNTAWDGGGVYLSIVDSGDRCVFANCLFRDNLAFNDGGAIYLANTQVPFPGGNPGEVEITHTTIADNITGLWVDDAFPFDGQDPDMPVRVRSSILYGNSNFSQFWNIAGPEAANVQVNHSDVELGAGVWPGAGNLNVDPQFLNPGSNNYRLQLSSPCIDAADDTPLLPETSPDGLGDLADLDFDNITNELLRFALGNTVREFNMPAVPNTGLNATGTLAPISDMGCYEAIIRNIQPL